MSKQLIVIDDSGDPGFKKASSSNFVIAAALFLDLDVAQELSTRIALFRKNLGWRADHEFKFAKIRKDIIVDLLKLISTYDFKIYAAYIDKKSFRQYSFSTNENLYYWTIKELLQEMPLDESKIEIDGRSSKQNMQRMATYLRKEVADKSKLRIVFEDSSKDNLIQLADLIAGSINRSFTDKTDAKTYLRIIKSKIVLLKRIDTK